jgi:hypothetical protein
MNISLEKIVDKTITFDTVKSVSSIDVLKEYSKLKIDNNFVHILLEKGVNIPNAEPVKEVVFDQVWCFETDEETKKFIDYIQVFNK